MEDVPEIEIRISELEDEIHDHQREIWELEKRLDALEGKAKKTPLKIETPITKKENLCHTCGDPDDPSKPLKYTADPYNEAAYNDDTENWYCEDCLYISYMDS